MVNGNSELNITNIASVPNGKDVNFSELLEKYNSAIMEIADLKLEIANLEKALYGQRSEKSKVIFNDDGQIKLFDEVEKEAETTLKEEEKSITVPEHKRKPKRKREEILKNLEVEEVVYTLEDKTCPECGTEMICIGKDLLREELVYVPAKMFVRRYSAETYMCSRCGQNNADTDKFDESKPVFKKADARCPDAMLPGCICSPELLAHILFEKYVQAVPLNRQEKEYIALGAEISRTTMANWTIAATAKYIKPVYDLMKAELLKGTVIHADETVVQVLHEKNRKAKTQSRMWVYAASKSVGHANVLFDYCYTRGGYNAVGFLGEYSGYLVCDGYDGYNKLTEVKRCGCWAHARRKFTEALPTGEANTKDSKAAQGVEWINKIFNLEGEFEKLSSEDKLKQRQERMKPILDDFYAWVDTINPGSEKLRKAKQYVLNEKKYLCAFLEAPEVDVSNNTAENAIRPFVVGRKNWLFSTSENGAEASAMLYSLATTAYANGLKVEEYFAKLLSSKEPVMPWN